MQIRLYIDFQDNDDVVHKTYSSTFDSTDTLQQVKDKIQPVFRISQENQQLFSDCGVELVEFGETLQSRGVKDGSKIIVKHAHLPLWDEFKECANSVIIKKLDKVANSKRAVELIKRLINSNFLVIYSSFNNIWNESASEINFWADDSEAMIRDAAKHYFLKLHNEQKGNSNSEFVCYFEERGWGYGGWAQNTLAFVQIHGESSVVKYNVKCHRSDLNGTKPHREPDINELYCYTLLSLIGVCPKLHIIPPTISTGSKTNTYIATQWDDNFELLNNDEDDEFDRKNLCADIIVQLTMLEILLFTFPLCEERYGRWKGTNNIALVSVSVQENFNIYPDIKKDLLENIGYWKDDNAADRQYNENHWLTLAKVYLDKWDFLSKIELAREHLESNDVFSISYEFCDRVLDEYIDTLKTNLGNLEVVLNQIT